MGKFYMGNQTRNLTIVYTIDWTIIRNFGKNIAQTMSVIIDYFSLQTLEYKSD